jgi:hypothetical protein
MVQNRVKWQVVVDTVFGTDLQRENLLYFCVTNLEIYEFYTELCMFVCLHDGWNVM